jgi:D-glycero-D-manno-heptose 1,7-bisphosphate phosphatase
MRYDTVFVDRDGVINVNRADHVRAWHQFTFLPGSLEALALLRRSGRRVFVVTNQAIVARGLISPTELARLHARMRSVVAGAGGWIDAVLVCPHRPTDGCACRKPAPGLLQHAAAAHAVELARSVLVGDHLSDLLAAESAGCHSYLVLSGRTDAADVPALPPGCLGVLPDLLAAAQAIVTTSPAVRAHTEQPRRGDAAAVLSVAAHGSARC